MAKPIFSKPEKQAKDLVKELWRDGKIKSLGTERGYRQALKTAAEWSKSQRLKDGAGLRNISPEEAKQYLTSRSEIIGQKALDMERQALQTLMQHTGKLAPNERLERTKSTQEIIEKTRSYTREQVALITQRQTPQHQLATRIALEAGLRAHELHTLRRAEEKPADPRPARDEKFSGRPEGVRYTVEGKGGLTREVHLPMALAQELEKHRLPTPESIQDRGIWYKTNYAISGGKNWSNSFGRASKTAVGWSNGAHGLRHTYAKERMDTLQKNGITRRDSLEIVSQELGHFRPEITEVYLR